MSFNAAIKSIYLVGDHPIEPFIGAAYTEARATDFRLVMVGINTHISDEDMPRAKPSWFSGGFRGGDHHFFRQAHRDGDALAAALASAARGFEKLTYRPEGKAGFYVTNAIKRHMAKEYKRARRLSPKDYALHRPQWERELRAMADHGVLPHLIVLYGGEVWNQHGWRMLRPGEEHYASLEAAGLRVTKYDVATGNCDTHAARVGLEAGGQQHELFLVRLSRPAHRNKRVTHDAKWILRQSTFRRLAGLPPA